jgi:hypothetical protein
MTDRITLTDEEFEQLREAVESIPNMTLSVPAVASVESIVAARVAEAWDEGYEAGDMDARAVNPAWPDRTLNPYRDPQEES